MNELKLLEALKQFLIEDLGERDISSEAIFPEHEQGMAVLTAKENGVFSGEKIVAAGFKLLDPTFEIQPFIRDGQSFSEGDELAIIKGPVRYILQGERVILNLIQRMSGIATLTKKAVNILNSNHTRICDTRKTTPGLRMFEKYAVRCGGGFNHRFGLYDGVMIKDNHIAFCGSIKEAVRKVRGQIGHMVKIEIEIETEKELIEAIETDVDIIMFDNCTPMEVKRFVHLTPSHIITEASGGIDFHNLADYRDTNVDYISLGMLTHSVKSLDISLNVK
ncbi:carboxylating nicotinate-nucleotide diphosphorylase [Bacillus alveayuensis]|jgi:nicotinate-nucleotide pyrophosphorylase (carboxylating)|uniref:carboxylating nicotinate-nucleotide diphosphorylase n=1 Tax=Aeribacillus alveayuensis TaxID=279215 RepID=UPI0005D128E3|nr:carboxylating nicotinate-nucleotide diphosphorylase [Bacillus alveayuensis]